jgi:DNA polymerase III alpha subunit (gram-positive type)
MTQMIFYDFETTGLNPFHEEIIEYSFNNDKTKHSMTGLVKPTKELNPIITQITGITDKILMNQLPLNNHIEPVFNYITSCDDQVYLIAHNNDGFDRFFLRRMFKNNPHMNAVSKKWRYIDTLLLAKIVLPNNKSYSLKTLCSYFNLIEGTHRAEDDTRALKNVYYKLVQMYCYKTKLNFDDIISNPSFIHDLIY